ncbi:PhoP family transcriptional regulator [Desulfitobacterium hafniense]|uniref:Stage 0 sporulation protein A homolog n=1 Tax=Desulfitobacterium hafniense TaxID=49338 RepID=A0A0W1JDR4_DESHA|nr:response regulator transcription factor [Desulfitobacterium hafniense]KTE89600.1 PhoP family transcriptional regulator [Desulfitobacterium hafniense]
MTKEKILIADDEVELAELVKDFLSDEQYEALVARDGHEALELFRMNQPQLVILDIMMPGLDGMEVCRRIRAESNVPIIMLSAKKAEVDKILGLGLGADDYIVKPFSPGEVVARVKAQLRRFKMSAVPEPKTRLLSYSGLEIDVQGYEAALSGRPLELTTKEFELLRFLALHPNQVLTREQIFANVWGFNESGDLNNVTVHIKKLREKIESDLANPTFIKTVWGVGYKFSGGAK